MQTYFFNFQPGLGHSVVCSAPFASLRHPAVGSPPAISHQTAYDHIPLKVTSLQFYHLDLIDQLYSSASPMHGWLSTPPVSARWIRWRYLYLSAESSRLRSRGQGRPSKPTGRKSFWVQSMPLSDGCLHNSDVFSARGANLLYGRSEAINLSFGWKSVLNEYDLFLVWNNLAS